ncbi:hypothetical protein [Candidatus Cyanaurora vandensis]|nr:hypothetical protein [Candidatus Cyanaurora vandensis]
MAIHIRRDLMYAILSHIQGLDESDLEPIPSLSERDFGHLNATPAEVIGHMDYLYQQGCFRGVFERGSYGDRELEVGSFNHPPDIIKDINGPDLPPDKIEAAPDPKDVIPIDGAIDVEHVRLTVAGRHLLADLTKEQPAPEPSRLA